MKNYKIYKGDCFDIMKTLSKNSVDCIITDPPYGVGFKNDFYNDSENYVLKQIPRWYKQWYRLLKEDCYLYLFVGVKTIHNWIQEGINAGFTFKNILATRSFNNGAISPKNNFGFQFQPVLVFSKGKGKPFRKVNFIPTSKEWYNDRRNKNPKKWTYQYPNWIKTEWAYASAKTSTNSIHPNEKNNDLLKFLVKLSTRKNQIVLDSFMGSASTGIACLQTGRKFIGIEITPKYYKFSKKRLKNESKNLQC